MCKRFPGFLRVAIADPQPERRWFRRGWVSFERQVNIKEICWSLNNIRVSIIYIQLVPYYFIVLNVMYIYVYIYLWILFILEQLRDCELGAIVNRDLSRRIRRVNGITSHKQIIRQDIKLSAKIVHNLDNRVGLWNEEKREENSNKQNDDNKENTASQSEVEQAVSRQKFFLFLLFSMFDYFIT